MCYEEVKQCYENLTQYDMLKKTHLGKKKVH